MVAVALSCLCDEFQQSKGGFQKRFGAPVVIRLTHETNPHKIRIWLRNVASTRVQCLARVERAFIFLFTASSIISTILGKHSHPKGNFWCAKE
jgi:hypothetical protein